MRKNDLLTNCKLHCGCSGVRYLCSFLDRLRPADADALRNPQRQLASDRSEPHPPDPPDRGFFFLQTT